MLGGLAIHGYVTIKHDAHSIYEIRSGVSGGCMDLRHDTTTNQAVVVQLWDCNGSAAQAWTTTATTIRQGTKCLTTTSNRLITLTGCGTSPSQVWLRDKTGYFNPATQKCLSAASGIGHQLTLTSCDDLQSTTETWSTESGSTEPVCGGNEETTIACQAVKAWTTWQADNSDHEKLLTTYTAGTPDEAWCADFVSYVYKVAGYPFTSGGYAGWDENTADNIQYMGFTKHTADGSYTPRAGDVAYFNYAGGHVEIVVSGGAHPTFVYGDSATIDPTTGNGQMKANTITQDGSSGGVAYYLSPIHT